MEKTWKGWTRKNNVTVSSSVALGVVFAVESFGVLYLVMDDSVAVVILWGSGVLDVPRFRFCFVKSPALDVLTTQGIGDEDSTEI